MKTLVILPFKYLPPLPQSVLCNFHFSGQPNGWMTGMIFKNIVEVEFVAEIEKRRKLYGNSPAILILDNHSSRNSLDKILLWENHRIKIIEIPQNSSHITQPLDLSVNGELKTTMKNLVKQNNIENCSLTEAWARILEMVVIAMEKSLVSYYINIGWRRTGIYPFNFDDVMNNNLIIDYSSEIQGLGDVKKKRKRGPNISNGAILYDGERLVEIK